MNFSGGGSASRSVQRGLVDLTAGTAYSVYDHVVTISTVDPAKATLTMNNSIIEKTYTEMMMFQAWISSATTITIRITRYGGSKSYRFAWEVAE